jgi:hypothetical protein
MIGRVDQAVLLLQDRLAKLANKGGARSGQVAAGHAIDADPIEKLRALRAAGQLDRDELGRALVRSLLVDSLGTSLAGSLDFQALADQVSVALAQNESGRALMDQTLAQLGLD